MDKQNTIALYHGTDLKSAIDILTHGLDAHKLGTLQAGRKVQLGKGWYTTDNATAALYFASIAPGNMDKGATVLEIELFVEHLEMLIEQRLVKTGKIANVQFDADQYLFDIQTFEFLNQHATLRPYKWREE